MKTSTKVVLMSTMAKKKSDEADKRDSKSSKQKGTTNKKEDPNKVFSTRGKQK